VEGVSIPGAGVKLTAGAVIPDYVLGNVADAFIGAITTGGEGKPHTKVVAIN
jgi:hypothetical protein